MKLANGTSWQYFTMFCDDGTKIAGAFTATDKNCDVWLSVYGNRTIEMQRYYSLDYFTKLSEGNLRIDGSYFVRDDGKVRLRIRQPNLELMINAKSVIDWKGNAIRYKAGMIDVEWLVPGLRMDAEGVLSVDGERKRLKGLMFHDSVRHNIKPSLDMIVNYNRWVWGIGYTKSYSVLFAEVDYRKRPFRFLCINDSRKTVSSNDSIAQADFEFISPRRMPLGSFDIAHGGHYMRFSGLKPFGLVHGKGLSKLWARLAERKHHYVGRFLCEGEAGEAYLESHKLF